MATFNGSQDAGVGPTTRKRFNSIVPPIQSREITSSLSQSRVRVSNFNNIIIPLIRPLVK